MSVDELNRFNRIGTGQTLLTDDQLTQSPKSQVCIINAHGCLHKNISHVLLIFNNFLLHENIYLLQKQTKVKHFYVFTCYGGAAYRSLPLIQKNLKKGTTITCFSSGKFPLPSCYVEGLIKKIYAFYQEHKALEIKKIEKLFFLENALFPFFTILRCEITDEKKFLAFKVRAPKEEIDIQQCEDYLRNTRQIKSLIIEDQAAFLFWENQIAKNTPSLDFNLKKYLTLSMIDAVCRSKIERVRTWIEQGAQVNFEDLSPVAWPPLTSACGNGNEAIVKMLIQKGAEINYRSEDEITALSIASQNGHSEIVQMLIKKGAQITNRPGDQRAFLVAIRRHYSPIVQLLIDSKANVNLKDINNSTPLLIATLNGDFEIARLLINYDADISLPGFNGVTPLLAAHYKNEVEIIQLFLKKLCENEIKKRARMKNGNFDSSLVRMIRMN